MHRSSAPILRALTFKAESTAARIPIQLRWTLVRPPQLRRNRWSFAIETFEGNREPSLSTTGLLLAIRPFAPGIRTGRQALAVPRPLALFYRFADNLLR